MRNLSVGSASFSATNILFFFAKAMQKPLLFYELRREREEKWRGKGGESMEINNLKRNRLGVFRVVLTPQKSTYCCKFIPGLYLRRSKKRLIMMMI